MTQGKRCCSTCRFLMKPRNSNEGLPRCVAPVPQWIKAKFPWIDIISDPDGYGVECLAWLARSSKKKEA